MPIRIDPEFQSLIPPLLPEDLAALEESLIREGCRHPLVVWENTLVDGHHRHEICTRLNIPFRTVNLERVDTRESVMLWMVNAQFARRNLNDYQRTELALRRKRLLAAQAKLKQQEGTNQYPSSLSTNLSKGSRLDTRRDIAEVANVAEGTVAKVEKIQRNATPEVIEAARAGRIKIDVAAHLAVLPPVEQVSLATAGPAAMKAAAKGMREEKKKVHENDPSGVPDSAERVQGASASKLKSGAKLRASTKKNKKLSFLNEILTTENRLLRTENENLQTENENLQTENAMLKERVERLEAEAMRIKQGVNAAILIESGGIAAGSVATSAGECA